MMNFKKTCPQLLASICLAQSGRARPPVLRNSCPRPNSALDTSYNAKGRDIGNVIVQHRVGGKLVDAAHDLTFAFVFHAFIQGGALYK
jgi:hypothetical protein